jgi:hypothetical protein
MNKLLLSCLAVLASAASATTPLENASALAEQLGGSPIAIPAAASIATPPSAPVAPAAAAALAAASAASVKISALTGGSGSISGYASATGNGSMNCNGSWMNGWANLTAYVSVTTEDGANAQFPVSGMAFLSGTCQNNVGFVSGSAMMNGSGSLYKAGRYVGSVNLSGNAFINQYVNAPFAWINQNVYLSGSYNETGVAAK